MEVRMNTSLINARGLSLDAFNVMPGLVLEWEGTDRLVVTHVEHGDGENFPEEHVRITGWIALADQEVSADDPQYVSIISDYDQTPVTVVGVSIHPRDTDNFNFGTS
jgi:hypothetical protein